MSSKSYHNPIGNPCHKCGKGPLMHRVNHVFEAMKEGGTICGKCDLPKQCHKERKYHVFVPDPKDDYLCVKCGLQRSRHRSHEHIKRRDVRITYIGIDGEGQGRVDHRYTMLGASDEYGEQTWCVEAERLSTEQCLELILGLPTKRTKIFSYSFNYDLTKMLEDLDDASLYLLFRPELRPGKRGPRYVRWGKYYLNLQGTKFTVKKGRKRVVIWDLFKFYQSKFVVSLENWRVGDKRLWERMTLMKDRRGEFEDLVKRGIITEESIRNYSLEECACMGKLARKLVEAHEDRNLKLRSFYGAGSSGAAMLTAMGIKDKIKPVPDEMKIAVACAFSGGRFENSVIGEIQGPIYDYDISSAYPYQLVFLPCLLHGRWEFTRRRSDIDGKKTALVRYTLGSNPGITDWGPFPFRIGNGSICYPITSGGGWVWLDEYLAGERHFPHVYFEEAWVYHCECDCRPFEKVPGYYIERLILGKEGPGLVLKLGLNSCYGKLAQSIGSALFNSWIWAGLITSGTRAQNLDILAAHSNRANLLTIATDGIKTREKLKPALPRDTGTMGWIDPDTGLAKPLGGWEGPRWNAAKQKWENVIEQGLFVARPGIYFPLNPTKEQIKEVKGRGVGKGVVLENWPRIVDAWRKQGVEGTADVANVTRFCGAKTSISYSPKRKRYTRASGTNGKPHYGQWITREVKMSFDPMPKRECVNPDGVTLKLREFPKDLMSQPYRRALNGRNQMSPDALEMRAAVQELLEQPDCDLTEFELDPNEG